MSSGRRQRLASELRRPDVPLAREAIEDDQPADRPHSALQMTSVGRVVESLHALRGDLSPAERIALDDFLIRAGVSERTPVEYNPFLPGVHLDPYPHYHRIQHDNPVHWSEAMQAWVISRFEDVKAAFRDERLSYRTGFDTIMASVPAEEHQDVQAVTAFLTSLLNEIDPPDHTRLRKIMNRALARTTRASNDWNAHLASVADALLDAVEGQGEMDLVADYAYPLPVIVGCDVLGIPTSDRERFNNLVDDLVHTFSDGFSGTEAMKRGEAAVYELVAQLEAELQKRRRAPQDDVLGALVEANEANDHERVLIATNIIMGLHENVTNAIALGARLLLENEDLWRSLSDHPHSVGAVAEEILRFEGTAPILSRVALEDVPVGSATIPKGRRVILLLGAANRDAEAFHDPDTFSAARQPNHHIAFGFGRRRCPGAAIGRQMVEVALATLQRRLPHLRLLDSRLAWREEINIRGLSSLRVSWQ